MKFDRRLVQFISALIVAAGATGCGRDFRPDVTLALEPVLARSSRDGVTRAVWKDTQAFYERRAGRPAWTIRREASPRADKALAVLERAIEHGFSPHDYGWQTLQAQRAALESDDMDDEARVRAMAAFDLGVTTSLLGLGRDVAVGRTRPAGPWLARRTAPDLVDSLARTSTGDLELWLHAVRPRHPQYAALEAALLDLLAREEAGPSAADQDPPIAQRIRLVALNMERWRWMPDALGDRHVLVNIPAYELSVFEGGRDVLSMPVVVGSRGLQTPVFSSDMKTVVFSPYWHIPESIVANETALAAAKDPDYLRRNGIEVIRAGEAGPLDPDSVDWDDSEAVRGVALRQKPGAANALGHVKFLFPNRFNVYLHDTPTESAFDRKMRALSHGCVRLEQPEAMARQVLRDQPEWDDARIARAMHSGTERHVALGAALPVHIAYFTAWADEAGRVEFFADVYGHDRRQLARLKR